MGAQLLPQIWLKAVMAGYHQFLVPVKSVEALAQAMMKFSN